MIPNPEYRVDDMPFEVPLHDRMIMRVRGKLPNTVLTIESMFFTWRIAEYTEPLSYGRHWCFEDLGEALVALVAYIELEIATEPAGWVRAIDFDNGYRTRRASINSEGVPVIVVVDDE